MLIDLIQRYLQEIEKSPNEEILQEVAELSKASFQRQFLTSKEESDHRLRLSSLGKCARAQAYQLHRFAPNGKTLDGRARLTFFAGDVAEISLIQLAKLAVNKYKAGDIIYAGTKQATVKIKVNDTEIEGHPDGIFLPSHVEVGSLVECKSFSSFSFKRFEQGFIDETYLAQANMYMEALGLSKCVFLGYNKDNSVIHENIVEKSPNIVKKTLDNARSILESTKENLPERPYKPDEDTGFLPWPCNYCAYSVTCWPEAEKVVVNKAYKLKIKKEIQHGKPQTVAK